ncbi:MAG: hypothetical protein A3A94_02110 [Candidatus Portnoybacteria bacterium RIFCSPLOWO2_01_FULL_43_11]|uniref:HIT domain-containing protein n=4 Tax=Candidatus Portnoyibacteriota TaxID=1817913 RepID=A0A1G2FBX9_9BACT|nr:MAG: hypothetical protein A2815_01915 [Candidatus Portnoybacteria bacterium RIFCSPHIGHO2_01_FULL_40_12b]OGZ37163.1 MAG: hypothetical protein A3D38_01330 [Candidatus Portnoybacteria bacterium RIFCSPHIGHO2_02_FULL_40_23]OGZ37689.1 MAG: hypothetical protein A3E90_00155 [Candidatus Portnoybacteria bacterium RIFCSPHIGHO2_12_FULL_40_11]OGZ38809.1 MAG: hypothetical protein A3A94_02110 [Candidatus Portnoybacteria bacterium RIFCSPLOWO2_01_FULL_43_11]OGZ40397.1 MAG: hypothetical protein A3I20_01815 [C
MTRFVNIKYAKGKEYKKVIKKIALTGKCPFCKENFKYHKEPILRKNNGWFLTHDSWPYKNSQYHLIIIGEKHREQFNELTKKDFESVANLTQWAIKKYNIKGGALATRFGDTNFTGASVAHIHFHIISPKQDKKREGSKVVNFPIG